MSEVTREPAPAPNASHEGVPENEEEQPTWAQQAATRRRVIQRKASGAAAQAGEVARGIGKALTKVAVRVRHSAGGDRIGALKPGAEVIVLERIGEWLHVELPKAAGIATAFITALPEFVHFAPVEKPAKEEKPESSGGTLAGIVGAAEHLAHDVAKGAEDLWTAAEEGFDHWLHHDEKKAQPNGPADKPQPSTGGGGAGANDPSATAQQGAGTQAAGAGGADPGASGGAVATTPAQYAVLDPKALVYSDPPELKASAQTIPPGTLVDVVAEQVKGGKSYVKLQQHAGKDGGGGGQVLGWTAKSNLGSAKEADPALKPDDEIALDKLSGLQRAMALIYNSKGKYLQERADAMGVPVEGLAAVLHVESSGTGFKPDGRMIIRFENHIFFSQWGSSNKAVFDKHFKFDPDKKWEGHQWRRDENGAWEPCHASQAQEWNTLDFARSLADEGAIKSASYGVGQTMGFNFEKLGYKSAKEMFDSMNGALKPQIDGMFSFIQGTKNCYEGLKARDYVKFASGYNGTGKAEEYGAAVHSAADAFVAALQTKTKK